MSGRPFQRFAHTQELRKLSALAGGGDRVAAATEESPELGAIRRSASGDVMHIGRAGHVNVAAAARFGSARIVSAQAARFEPDTKEGRDVASGDLP